MRPSWILISLFWATALFLSAQARLSTGDYSGEFRASLEEERRLGMLLRLESGGISTRLAFGASAEGFSIASSVDVSGSDPGGLGWGARFLAGPGSPSGALAVLTAPTAYASGLSARGFPLRLDPSLAASTSVLGLGVDLGLGRQEGSLALFGAASGLEGGFLFGRAGLVGGDEDSIEEAPGLPEALAIGSAYCLRAASPAPLSSRDSGFTLLSALSLRREKEGSGGWEPETRSLPADLGAFVALLSERRSREGAVRWAWAAEAYPHEAPAFACRFEAEESSGALTARIRAGTAGAGFRLLLGARPERLAALALDFRLALRRAAAATLSLRAEAPSLEELKSASPVFSPALSLGLELPLGAEGLVAHPLLAFEWGDSPGGSFSLGLRWTKGGLSCSSKAGLELLGGGNGAAAGPSGGADGLVLDGTASVDFLFQPESGDEPSVDCRISLKAEGLASDAFPAPTADASIKLEWGLASTGRLSLGVAVEGAALQVSCPGTAEGGVRGGANSGAADGIRAKVSVAYRVSLGGEP